MIDVESYIFNAVYDTVAPLCARNAFKGIHTPNPTVFPTATLFEMDNRIDQNTWTGRENEDFVILTYEAHVYANTKAECRKVFAALDEALLKMNLTRMSGTYIPNLQNSKVHEYVARYRVMADREGKLYRRS